MPKAPRAKTKRMKGTTKKNAEKKQKTKRKHYAKDSDIKQQAQNSALCKTFSQETIKYERKRK